MATMSRRSASMISSRRSFQASTNAFDERTAAGGSGCHRVADLVRDRLHVAQRIENRPDAEETQRTGGLVVLVDRRGQCVLVRWIAAGEAVEAVQEDHRPVGGGASLLALLPVVLAAQPFVLEARAVAVESQRRQGRGRHTGDADRAGDDAGPDSIARHRWHRSRGGRLSSSGSFERVAIGASGVTSRRRWRPHRTGEANGDPARVGSASGAQAEATYEVEHAVVRVRRRGPLSRMTPYCAPSDAR